MTKTLLDQIDNIPPLPESVQAVEAVYQDLDSTFEDMQKVIEKDPFLTADILRIVNAPMYGMTRKITRVGQAIALLGKDAIRTFVLNTAVNASFKIDLSPYNLTNEQFSLACEKQLALVLNWMRSKPEYIATLAPAAFLVDLGRVLISKSVLEEHKEGIIQKALQEGESILAAEKLASGAEVTDVTARLFHKWNLDEQINYIIRCSDNPDETDGEEKQMAAILRAVRKTVLFNGDINEESIANAKAVIAEYNLDLQGYENALKKVMSL